jgi:hypothetical protein
LLVACLADKYVRTRVCGVCPCSHPYTCLRLGCEYLHVCHVCGHGCLVWCPGRSKWQGVGWSATASVHGTRKAYCSCSCSRCCANCQWQYPLLHAAAGAACADPGRSGDLCWLVCLLFLLGSLAAPLSFTCCWAQSSLSLRGLLDLDSPCRVFLLADGQGGRGGR